MVRVRRLLLPILLGLAAYYALFGGEYSLLEIHQARREIRLQQEELDQLKAEVEYLRARADSLEHDSATLERLAREHFGMLRDGEVLYRMSEPRDSAEDTLR